MAELLKHYPPPVESTYSITGLSAKELRFLAGLLHETSLSYGTLSTQIRDELANKHGLDLLSYHEAYVLYNQIRCNLAYPSVRKCQSD